MNNFDVIVIGAGPGGYVAAIRSAQLGKKVALIEKNELGGICLNWGCVPTKAMLKSAQLYKQMQISEKYGLTAGPIKFDLNKIVNYSKEVSAGLVKGISGLIKKNKITLVNGHAKFINSKELEVEVDSNKEKFTADNIIIATGARARILPGFEPSSKIWTYKDALRPTSLPKSMIIVGSGAIGVEFASFYASFGCEVTVLEAQETILPVEDKDISSIARGEFEKSGIKFKTSIKLLSQKEVKDGIELTFEENGKSQKISAEKLLMAVGIVANSDNINLEATRVKCEKGRILTDGYLQTDDKHIYAIGDVAGSPWLAHKASHEGIIAAERISGLTPHKINQLNIPGCTYSSPQIASVGLTEQAAIGLGYEIRVGKFPFIANAKAIIVGDQTGLIKTIFDKKTGELLGAHMVGEGVTELISSYVVAKEMETTEQELINTIFPHPTMSEMMHESVLAAFGRQIHL